jgi:exonuclease SbcC
MDYGTFTRSVFSKQKEIDALSDARPEERRKAIQRMVGVDTVTRARDVARTERREKEAEVEGARRAVEALPGKRAELHGLAPQITAARETVSEERRAATAAAKAARTARDKLNRLDKKRSRHAVLEKDSSGLSGDLRGALKREDQLRKELVALTEAKSELAALLPQGRAFDRVRQAKEAMDRASGKHEERVELHGEIDELLTEKDRLKKDLDASRQASSKLRGATKAERATRATERKARAALSKQQKARGQAQNQLGRVESQAAKAKKALAEVRKLGPRGKCPTCYRHLGGSFEEIVAHLEAERDHYVAACGAAQKKVADIDAKIRAVSRRIEEAVRQVSAAVSAAKQAGQAKERLAAARERHARTLKTLREKRGRLRALAKVRYDEGRHRALDEQYEKLSPIHDKVEALRQEVSRVLSVSRDLRARTQEAKRLRRQIRGVERRQAALAFDPAAYATARKASDAAQAADKAAALAHSAAVGKLGLLAEGQRHLRDEIKRLEKLRARIGKDEEAIRYLARIEALLDEFRIELINRVRPQIEEYASGFLEQVTSGRYPRISLDEDYAMSIHDGTDAYPVRRFSGGEGDLANLCLRLAISEVVAQRAGRDASSLVVLDEIFGSQDTERRERILQALGQLEATFQQIVLITHMEDIHDRVAHVLRVTENSGHDAEAAWA